MLEGIQLQRKYHLVWPGLYSFWPLKLQRLSPQRQFQYLVVSLYISLYACDSWDFPVFCLFRAISENISREISSNSRISWAQCKNSYPICDRVSDTYQKKDGGILHVRSRVNLQIWGEGSGGRVAVWGRGCTADMSSQADVSYCRSADAKRGAREWAWSHNLSQKIWVPPVHSPNPQSNSIKHPKQIIRRLVQTAERGHMSHVTLQSAHMWPIRSN